MSYILCIDAGTTSVRIIVLDKQMNIVAKESAELTQYYPQQGWVEHDPVELIIKTKALMEKVMQDKKITAIGITNQRETIVMWNKNKPIANAIVWQCRRTTERCKEMKVHEAIIKQKTGLVLDPYFSATKIQWLLEKYRPQEIVVGTIDSWLIWNLTGKHVTDTSNASRTMLFNIQTMQWDDELLRLFNIPRQILPEVKQSSEIYGHYKGIPVAGIAGDQQAALFGQCCFEKNSVKNTYGTGCFIMQNTGEKIIASKDLLTTVAWTINNKTTYALEGSVFIAGAAIQWLKDGLQIIKHAKETEHAADSNTGVYFVPALTGLGCPHWNPHARGMITGLTRATTKFHIMRAAIESIAYQTKDVIEILPCITELKADGGASANQMLMQFQADILNANVIVPTNKETTAVGAGFLAGLAVNFWTVDEIKKYWQAEKKYYPKMPEQERAELYAQWKKAVTLCNSSS